MQGGPGYRFAERRGECLDSPLPDDIDDCADRGPSESENSVIFRGDLGLDHQLTETTKIVERFLVEAGSDNTYLQNDLGLEVSINGALALRVGYQVRYNTDVLPGTENTGFTQRTPFQQALIQHTSAPRRSASRARLI